METLGTFILNVKKKFLTISYEEKKITLQDFIVETCIEIPSSNDIDHMQNVAIQCDKESQQQSYDDLEGKIRDLNKILINKDEEIVQTQRKLECQDTKVHKIQQ
jgi:hypothetical protein